MALVVSKQLRACWGLWLLQRNFTVERLLGRIQRCLVDSLWWGLLWTSWSEWALWLRRAVLELCRHRCFAWLAHAHAYARAHTSAHANASTNARACTNAHAYAYAYAYTAAGRHMQWACMF